MTGSATISGSWLRLTDRVPAPLMARQNNALQLTRSRGLFHTWSRFAAPRVPVCGGPSQLNAVFGRRSSVAMEPSK